MSEAKVKCPLVDDEEIEIGYCVIVSSIANECITENRLPFKLKNMKTGEKFARTVNTMIVKNHFNIMLR